MISLLAAVDCAFQGGPFFCLLFLSLSFTLSLSLFLCSHSEKKKLSGEREQSLSLIRETHGSKSPPRVYD